MLVNVLPEVKITVKEMLIKFYFVVVTGDSNVPSEYKNHSLK